MSQLLCVTVTLCVSVGMTVCVSDSECRYVGVLVTLSVSLSV